MIWRTFFVFSLMSWGQAANSQIGPNSHDLCDIAQSCERSCDVKNCEEQKDNRNCKSGIFNFVDPICQAARSSQSTLFQIQKQDCERLRSHNIQLCEMEVNQCRSVANACSVLKARLSQAKWKKLNILWVDDNPINNKYEQNALRQLGASVMLVENTDDALQLLGTAKFNIIISDFSRRDDPSAGYTLLQKIREIPSMYKAPYLIYSASTNEKSVRDAKERGVFGQTNSSSELMKLIGQAAESLQ